MPKTTAGQKRAASPSMGDKGDAVAPANNAKKQMCSIFDEPAPPPMRKIRASKGGSGDSTALCKIQGVVVTRTKDEVVNGPRGPIPKKRIDIVVTGITANGAQDIIKSGVEGESYIFPSRVIDTPERAEAADKKEFKGKARELVVSPMQKVRKLSTFSSAFYKEGKEGGETGVNAAEPGMCVEISGVCVNEVIKNGVTNYYLNGGKVTCLADKAPGPGILPQHMMLLCQQQQMQEWSAFATSIPMKGFFNKESELNEAQLSQAVACQALWERLVEGTADRLAIMAQGKDESLAAQITNHEQRVRASAPAKLADGSMNLFLIDQYDCTLAPIVQTGLKPWNKVPGFIQKLQAGPEQAAQLPHAFTAPWVVNVETNGKALSVDLRVAYIFNKDAAMEALDKGADMPALATSSAAVPITLSLRDFAVKYGTLLEAKVTMGCRELLPPSPSSRPSPRSSTSRRAARTRSSRTSPRAARCTSTCTRRCSTPPSWCRRASSRPTSAAVARSLCRPRSRPRRPSSSSPPASPTCRTLRSSSTRRSPTRRSTSPTGRSSATCSTASCSSACSMRSRRTRTPRPTRPRARRCSRPRSRAPRPRRSRSSSPRSASCTRRCRERDENMPGDGSVR